jgi:uncharacterized protein with HEPN domain
MRSDALRLADMLRAIELIRSYTSAGEEAFFRDPKTIDAVAYAMLTLGEAASQVSPAIRAAHPRVAWTALIRRRNQMVHEYFRTSAAVLWAFVVGELDPLERALRKVTAPVR